MPVNYSENLQTVGLSMEVDRDKGILHFIPFQIMDYSGKFDFKQYMTTIRKIEESNPKCQLKLVDLKKYASS